MFNLNLNKVKIIGDGNIVFQDADGDVHTIVIDDFIKKFTAEKDARIKALENTLHDKDKIEKFSDYKIEILQNELEVLQKDKLFLENRVQNLLQDFSKIDISEADTLYKTAFHLFINGQLEDAINALDEGVLLKQEEAIKIKQTEQSKARLLKAKLLSIDSNFTEAAKNIEKMVELLPDFHTRVEAGNFYALLNDDENARRHYEQAKVFEGNDSQKAGLLTNLGVIYTRQNHFTDAENSYNEALKIRRHIAEKNPKELLSLGLLIQNLAVFKNVTLRYREAIKYHKESISILADIPEAERSNDFYYHLADAMEGLANAHTNVDELNDAEPLYHASLAILSNITVKSKQEYEYNSKSRGQCLINLGFFYRKANRLQRSKAAYYEALSSINKLSIITIQPNNPELSKIFNNLGLTYGIKGQFTKALDMLNKALAIRRKLAQTNPKTYLSDVAETLGNLAIVHKKIGKANEAEQLYNESLDINQKLVINNPDIYNIDLAEVEINFSIFYLDVKPDKSKSLDLLKKAIIKLNPYSNSNDKAKALLNNALAVVNQWGVYPPDFLRYAIA